MEKVCDNDDNKKPPVPVSEEALGCRMRTSHHQVEVNENTVSANGGLQPLLTYSIYPMLPEASTDL